MLTNEEIYFSFRYRRVEFIVYLHHHVILNIQKPDRFVHTLPKNTISYTKLRTAEKCFIPAENGLILCTATGSPTMTGVIKIHPECLHLN